MNILQFSYSPSVWFGNMADSLPQSDMANSLLQSNMADSLPQSNMADSLPQWLHWQNLDNVQYVGYSIYFAIFHVLLDILPFTPPGTPNPGPPLFQYCGLENRELPGGGALVLKMVRWIFFILHIINGLIIEVCNYNHNDVEYQINYKYIYTKYQTDFQVEYRDNISIALMSSSYSTDFWLSLQAAMGFLKQLCTEYNFHSILNYVFLVNRERH